MKINVIVHEYLMYRSVIALFLIYQIMLILCLANMV